VGLDMMVTGVGGWGEVLQQRVPPLLQDRDCSVLRAIHCPHIPPCHALGSCHAELINAVSALHLRCLSPNPGFPCRRFCDSVILWRQENPGCAVTPHVPRHQA